MSQSVIDPIKIYLQEVEDLFARGQATEHSYRGALERLVRAIEPNIEVTNEPQRTAVGAPDYVITRDRIPVGYIEAKDIGDSDLAGLKKNKEQFDRYKSAFGNIVFTDYLNFYFYREGAQVAKICIAEAYTHKISRITLLKENFLPLANRLKDFCVYRGQNIYESNTLAKMMASKARLMAEVISEALKADEEENIDSELRAQFASFKEILIHDIGKQKFADVYAQTLAYGMFAARVHDKNSDSFNRQAAAELIPASNPFLRKLFQYIAGYDLDARLAWIVDDLAEIFLHCNLVDILNNYGSATKTEDPVIHFYEDFLSEYDPEERKNRGVWYTPAPVVNFIVRAVDEILKTHFDLPAGLADTSKVKKLVSSDDGKEKIEKEFHRVQILDPATGTGTFLVEVVKQIYASFENQKGLWPNFVKESLLPRLNGFEILMASYAMAHLQLELFLKKTDVPESKQRLGIFLTNSLEAGANNIPHLPFAKWLSEEARAASTLKRDIPVMCIIGNPPYSGESYNKNDWIANLMENYKKEPGGTQQLQERNPKWLNDDYVKFIRLGEHFIERNDGGMLAYICPHGFLDNPTFRGMRWDLLKTFDTIYILDLHGNAKKKEKSPDGSIDQNVFNIMQGVCICIFIKTGKKKIDALGQVYHADLHGSRELKYKFLYENSLQSGAYKKIENIAPNYFFSPKNFVGQVEYDAGFAINELFPTNSAGIVTSRDAFTIHRSEETLHKTIKSFLKLDAEEARFKFKLGNDARDWQIAYAKKDLENSYPSKGVVCKIAYRPFDNRYTFYTGKTKGFHSMPRNEVMQHFLQGENIGLVSVRRQPLKTHTAYYFITDHIIANGYIRSDSVSIDSVFPLYTYPTDELHAERQHNLNMGIVNSIVEKLGLKFTAEKEIDTNSFAPIDILDYIYAVLHSPQYRETYKEFLKIDFPRVPYPHNAEKFWQLVKLGSELRELHLLTSARLNKFITSYPIAGDNKVSKISFVCDNTDNEESTGKVFINKTQYIDGVPKVAWEFFIGGYQPAQKWLKDRQDETLTAEEILHYQKVITALFFTSALMQEIDAVGVV